MAALAMLAAAYFWAVFVTTFTHPGQLGWDFNTPGNDFMVFHAAIAQALRLRFDLLYDVERFTAFMNARYASLLSYPLVFRPWVNPPGMLVLLLPLAGLPFLAAYAVFECVTAGALWAAISVRAAPPARIIAAVTLLSPAAAFGAVCGQASFLTAALLIGGTRLLPNHPLWGGAVLGLLSVKPQHAVLVPFVLLALRSARGAAAAALSGAALSLIAWAVFGTQAWTGWVALTRQNLAGADPRWFWHNQIWDSSVQTCAFLLGAGRQGSLIIAGVAACLSAAAVYRGFRSDRPRTIKLAVLLAATTLAAPHTGPYDLVLLVPACGYFLTAPGEKSPWLWCLALGLWCLPVMHQAYVSPPARLGPVLAAALVLAVMRMRQGKSWGESASPPRPPVVI